MPESDSVAELAEPRLTFVHLFRDALERGEKTATVRVGDRSRSLRKGQVVALLVESNAGEMENLGRGVIERVEVIPLKEVSQTDIRREGVGLRSHEELRELLRSLYSSNVGRDTIVTVIAFRRIENA